MRNLHVIADDHIYIVAHPGGNLLAVDIPARNAGGRVMVLGQKLIFTDDAVG